MSVLVACRHAAHPPPLIHSCPHPLCADRGAYIDQSQSFNVHMSDPNFGKLTSLHFYAWKKGLKTGARGRCMPAAAGTCATLAADCQLCA